MYKVILDEDHPNKSDLQDQNQIMILIINIDLKDKDHAHLWIYTSFICNKQLNM